METEDQKNDKNQIADLFEGVDDSVSFIKPMTDGLGFKDRVSEGVYTDEVYDPASDCGIVDLGQGKASHGTINIEASGELRVREPLGAQPILFHSGHDGLIKKTAKKSGESVFGAFIDVLLVFSFSIFTLAFLMELTSFSLSVSKMLAFDQNELGKVLIVFSAFFLSYKVGARVFYGKTLGEWSSRHQLGLLREQYKFYYPLQVLFRELVCLATGVFLLPVLSSVLGLDIGVYFSGLQTYMEQKK